MKTAMKKMMMALGRFVYGNWYGAVVVFVVVSAVLCGLQVVNCYFGDVVPWPKDLHFIIMLAAVANIGVAMIVSLCRREWGRALGQLVLSFVAFACSGFVVFVSYCIPTRMTTPPRRVWMHEVICQPSVMRPENMTFLGGISQRETVTVFAVADEGIDKSHFYPGSPWTGKVGNEAIAHYRSIMEFCRIDVSLPDDAVLSHCNGRDGKIMLIETSGKTYLVYERM